MAADPACAVVVWPLLGSMSVRPTVLLSAASLVVEGPFVARRSPDGESGVGRPAGWSVLAPLLLPLLLAATSAVLELLDGPAVVAISDGETGTAARTGD